MIRALLLTCLAVSSSSVAEGQGSREGLPSTGARLRGADSLLDSPLGLVAIGGPTLRVAKDGSTTWEPLHKVDGDSLYRVAADGERLLAAWEKEPLIHLFVPGKKQHLTFPKPTAALTPVSLWNVSDLFFEPTAAIVVMHGSAGRNTTSVVYRVPLDRVGAPQELFRQLGYSLFESGKNFVYVVPKQPEKLCNNNGCDIASVLTWTLTSNGPVSRVLLAAKANELRWGGPVFGSDDARIGFVMLEDKNVARLWRWYPASERLESSVVGGSAMDLSRFRYVGDEVVVLDVGREAGRSMTLTRIGADGKETKNSIAPPPRGDVDTAYDRSVYGIGRRGESLFVHWGNALVVVDAAGKTRALDVEPMLKRRNEWAGAAIPTKDALWLAVEVGGGRDFVQLTWSDFDKRAK